MRRRALPCRPALRWASVLLLFTAAHRSIGQLSCKQVTTTGASVLLIVGGSCSRGGLLGRSSDVEHECCRCRRLRGSGGENQDLPSRAGWVGDSDFASLVVDLHWDLKITQMVRGSPWKEQGVRPDERREGKERFQTWK